MNSNLTMKSVLSVVVIIAVVAFKYYQSSAVPPTKLPLPGTPADDAHAVRADVLPHGQFNGTTDPAVPRADIPQRDSVPVSAGKNEPASYRDLSEDEKHRGHTLQRHVGRTDEQLLQRLKDEPDISSASTYADRETAERCVGAAIAANQHKIQAWNQQGAQRPNLVIDFNGDGKTQIGRSIHSHATQSVPCYRSKVVLKAQGTGYYVLTSYPESR